MSFYRGEIYSERAHNKLAWDVHGPEQGGSAQLKLYIIC